MNLLDRYPGIAYFHMMGETMENMSPRNWRAFEAARQAVVGGGPATWWQHIQHDVAASRGIIFG